MGSPTLAVLRCREFTYNFLIHIHNHSQTHVCSLQELFWKMIESKSALGCAMGLESTLANRWCNFGKHSCRQSSPKGQMEAGSRHLAMECYWQVVEGGCHRPMMWQVSALSS